MSGRLRLREQTHLTAASLTVLPSGDEQNVIRFKINQPDMIDCMITAVASVTG
ncbi:MAG: hypothetical protein ACRCXB_11890 [Aeromonadaceae bacterium]